MTRSDLLVTEDEEILKHLKEKFRVMDWKTFKDQYLNLS